MIVFLKSRTNLKTNANQTNNSKNCVTQIIGK
ncbi:hypothetical protein PMI10_00534 [Flavobacterium sp. CF136]|nr:hypothetical protein PMI10_00534 [Flavobacterium sp. CF136]